MVEPETVFANPPHFEDLVRDGVDRAVELLNGIGESDCELGVLRIVTLRHLPRDFCMLLETPIGITVRGPDGTEVALGSKLKSMSLVRGGRDG